ncbi:hypothetical protein AM588_10011287 [Phytophthora nicotianae]|uniref:Myosin protein n=1 Tax=Phytophthora nicotianae TaxID=4792 RepID=A0A0W8DS92_PHYNI|nr:hypothetical protein AM588_10011287 [Phytophthora nicotianae]
MAEKRAARREGEKVWCPDPRNVWQLGTVVEDDGEKLHVLLPDADSEQQFTFEQVHPYDPSHSVNLDNVAEMDNLHEAPLLDLLRRRYLEDKIYTYTGDILISINPYKNIPMLYNFPELDSIGKLDNPVPHVYSTAHGAYHAMMKDGKCQSILVSGESGAGKTEASKYIMRYLANISEIGKKTPKAPKAENGGSSVEQCVLQSNPLLEAFGNAKTIRNDNSSRFGKFIKIYYHADGTISGATTSHFLLEKSRIVGSAESERNYHVFYQLCAGLSAEEKNALKLKPASEFYFLNQGNCMQVPEINDKKDFKELVEAMGTVGIPPELQRTIFRLVACVLHLGNVEFTENAKNESQIAHPEDVTNLAELMMVTPDELEFALTKRTMSAGARGSVAEIALTAVESVKSRNGLAKDIFSKIFDWLVSQINKSTSNVGGSAGVGAGSKFIGILDIFGFESLQVNSFEQLCINYTNEMLQQQFNQHVFVYEQEVYVEEGIDFSRLEFKDNGPCLDLIDKKPLGILPLLDEQGMLGRRASDENFIQKLHQTHLPKGKVPEGSTIYYSKPRFATDEFVIHHYAGEVTYNVNGFLEKNDDSLHNDLISLMDSSKCRGFNARLKYGKKARMRAVARNKAQIQIARIVRGFLARRHFQISRRRIIMIQARVRANRVRTEYLKGREATINSQAMIRRSLVRRKFLREKKMATRIEAFGRMVICRQRYLDERKKIILVQSLWRMHRIRKEYTKRDRQVTLLQSLWRCHAQAKKYRETKEKIITIQAFTRMSLERSRYLKLRSAARVVQSAVRTYLGRRQFIRFRRGVVKTQALYRGYVQRKKYRQTVERIIKVQSVFRQQRAHKLADVRRRSMARVLAVVRIFLSRVRMRNRTQALFDAANAYDLTEVLHIAQEMPGMLRVRDRDHEMMSLIHVAAKNGDLNLARFVLEENPQLEDLVYGKDTAGSTPLHYASRLAHLDMVRLLAKVANRNSTPGAHFDFGAARTRSASSTSSTSDDTPEAKLRSVSSVSTASMTTPSSRSPSKSVSIGNRSPVGGFDPRMRGMSTASTSSFSMQPTFKPGDHNAPKRNGRRTLVSSKTGNNRRLSSAIGGLPPVLPTTVQIEVYKEGFLRKASGTRWATKRYVMVDEVCLSYYKTEKDKIPLKIVELCDATIKRNSDVDCCFEIRSPRLKSSKNPDGMLSFVADTEQEVHEWMLAIRKVQGVRVTTTSPPNHNMICIDSGLRRDYVNMKNKLGFTPLHLAVQNDEDEGFEAAKVCVWLIENGADPNAIDVNGDTALHYAVELERYDLVETLMKRGADSSIKNVKGLSAVDIAEEEDLKEILNPATHVPKVEESPVEPEEPQADGMVPVQKLTPVTPSLLPPPDRLHDSTYVSVFLGAIAVATGPIMETPHFNLYIMDYKGAVVDTAQRTPKSLIQTGGNYWWFGNTWYLQTPLEHLKDGCVAVMELRHRSLVTQEVEVGCWTFFHLDLSKITTAPATFEMYAPPVDPLSKILARIPGDSFLQAEINVSL